MRFGSLRWGEQQRDLLLPTCSLRSNWGHLLGQGEGRFTRQNLRHIFSQERGARRSGTGREGEF